MGPLITKQSCLQCHASQGYKAGDIRGGISIAIPYLPKTPFISLLLGHLGIGLFGAMFIVFFGIKLDKAYKEIKRQAIYDALTGIPNRREFASRILMEFNRAKRDIYPISLIMCDIDWFKKYNDTYGHGMGDECLRKVAQTIQNSLKRPGDFCARYGGEEFVIILPNTDQNGALSLAEEICKNIINLKIPHEKSLFKLVTLSLGVATGKDFTIISYEDLIKLADMALYEAKEKGRNCVEASNKEIPPRQNL